MAIKKRKIMSNWGFVCIKFGMQLLEFAFVLPDTAEGTACPNEAQGIAFGFGEMPFDVSGGMKTVGQRIKQQGC